MLEERVQLLRVGIVVGVGPYSSSLRIWIDWLCQKSLTLKYAIISTTVWVIPWLSPDEASCCSTTEWGVISSESSWARNFFWTSKSGKGVNAMQSVQANPPHKQST